MKNKITAILLGLFILFICNTASALTKSRSEARYKACLSNQRVITTAIEIFNMDHPTSLDKYDEEVEQMLINEGYLKFKMQKPEFKCDYKMFDNGEIYCEYHGGIASDKIKPCPEFAEELEGIQRYKRNQEIEFILGILIILGFFVWIISFLKDLFSNSKESSNKNPSEENLELKKPTDSVVEEKKG